MRLPPSRYVLPNLFTLAAALCGVSCIVLAASAESAQQLYLAASLIPLGVLLDGFDGRVARLLHGESKFGVQMDSLSDSITFGVAPGILAYFWALDGLGIWGLLAAFAFVAGAMLRLARFNVQAEEDGGASAWFTGLPAPMAGLAVACLVALNTGWLGHDGVAPSVAPLVAGYMLLFALLMVSEVPFPTFKKVRLTPIMRLMAVSALGALVVIAFTLGWMVALAVLIGVYVSGGLAGSFVRKGRQLALVRRGANMDHSLLDVSDELDLFEDDDN